MITIIKIDVIFHKLIKWLLVYFFYACTELLNSCYIEFCIINEYNLTLMIKSKYDNEMRKGKKKLQFVNNEYEILLLFTICTIFCF